MKETIETIVSLFTDNPALNFASLLLAMLGIVFTIYFYFKSRRNKIPVYIVRTINLVKEKIQKIDTVEILYSGNKIENLSISKIALWNGGKETINSNDIALRMPLRLRMKNDFKILDSEILFQKNDANDFKINISKDNKSIDVNFDYFDFEEGVVLQLFHTGEKSEDIYLDGKVKSVDKILRKDLNSGILPAFLVGLLDNKWSGKKINGRNRKLIFGWTILIIGLLFLFLMPFMDPITNQVTKPTEPASFYTKALMFLPGILYVWLGYRTLKRRIPKGFNVFDDEF